MGWPRLLLVTAACWICQSAWTQSPTYGLGKTPSAEEIHAWDISISPDWKRASRRARHRQRRRATLRPQGMRGHATARKAHPEAMLPR